MIRYGTNAPKYAELIWVNPKNINYIIINDSYFVSLIRSGWVTNINRFYIFKNFHDTDAKKACFAHWIDDVPWENTKDYQTGLEIIRSGKPFKDFRTEEELRNRFKKLDNIFKEVKRDMRLKTGKELNVKAYREEGGIMVGIGANCEPLLLEGYHRLSIALILDLPIIPAQLGCVDIDAIGSLERYRLPPKIES